MNTQEYDELRDAVRNDRLDSLDTPDLLAVDRFMHETDDLDDVARLAGAVDPSDYPELLFKQAYRRWYALHMEQAVEEGHADLIRRFLDIHRMRSIDSDFAAMVLRDGHDDVARRLLKTKYTDASEALQAIVEDEALSETTIRETIDWFIEQDDAPSTIGGDLLKASMKRYDRTDDRSLFQTLLERYDDQLYEWHLRHALKKGHVELAELLIEHDAPLPELSWANNQLTGGGLSDGFTDVLDLILDEGYTFEGVRYASKLFANGYIESGYRALQQTDDRETIQKRNDERRVNVTGASTITYSTPSPTALEGLLKSDRAERTMVEELLDYYEPDQALDYEFDAPTAPNVQKRPELFGILIKSNMIENDDDVFKRASDHGGLQKLVDELNSDEQKRRYRQALVDENETAIEVLEQTLDTEAAWEELQFAITHETDDELKQLRRFEQFAEKYDRSLNDESDEPPNVEAVVSEFFEGLAKTAHPMPHEEGFADEPASEAAAVVSDLIDRGAPPATTEAYLKKAVQSNNSELVQQCIEGGGSVNSSVFYEALKQPDLELNEVVQGHYDPRSDVRERGMKTIIRAGRGLSNLLLLRANGGSIPEPNAVEESGEEDWTNEYLRAVSDLASTINERPPDKARQKHEQLLRCQQTIKSDSMPDPDTMPESFLIGMELLSVARRVDNTEAVAAIVEQYAPDAAELYSTDAWMEWMQYAGQAGHDPLIRTLTRRAPAEATITILGDTLSTEQLRAMVPDVEYPPVETITRALTGTSRELDEEMERATVLFSQADLSAEQQNDLFDSIIDQVPNYEFLASIMPDMPGLRIENEQTLNSIAEAVVIGRRSEVDAVYEMVIERLETSITDDQVLKQTLGGTSFIRRALKQVGISTDHARQLADHVEAPYSPETSKTKQLYERYQDYSAFYQNLLSREMLGEDEFTLVKALFNSSGSKTGVETEAVMEAIDGRHQQFYHQLAVEGPESLVRTLVEHGADPSSFLQDFIHDALGKGNLTRARFLAGLNDQTLTEAVDVQEAAEAAKDSKIPIAETLVEAGADPDHFADDLQARVARSHLDMDEKVEPIRRLDELGFEPGGTDADIRKVVETDEPEIVQLLGEVGLTYHSNAFYEAAASQSVETLDTLLDHYDPSERVLSRAINNVMNGGGSYEKLLALIEHGADPNHPKIDHPIGEALLVESPRSADDPYRDVAKLMRIGADPRIDDAILRTAIQDTQQATLVVLTENADYRRDVLGEMLTVAINEQRPAMLQQLLDTGADPTVNDNEALLQAAKRHAIDCLTKLVEHPDVDYHTESSTPLGAALSNSVNAEGVMNVFDYLLEKGSDLTLPMDTERLDGFVQDEYVNRPIDALQIMAADQLLDQPEGEEFFDRLFEQGGPGKGFLGWFLHELDSDRRAQIYPSLKPHLNGRQRKRLEAERSLKMKKTTIDTVD